MATSISTEVAAKNKRPLLVRRVFFRSAALALGLLVASLVGELALRLGGYGRSYTHPMSAFFEADDLTGCRGKANFVGRFRRADFDVVVEHDENGFRRAAEAAAAPVHNVYVLGDSFVWGYGVSQADLLTNQMQRRLGDQRVHNLGLIGAGTVEEYLLFQKHVRDRLKPGDTVVLVFFGNDFGDNLGLTMRGRASAAVEKGQIRVKPPEPGSACEAQLNRIRDASYLCNLMAFSADRFKHWQSGDRPRKRSLPSGDDLKEFLDEGSPAMQITRHYLAEFRDSCQPRQVRFLAVHVPGQAELGEDNISSTSDLSLSMEVAYRQAFERIVHELPIETVDLMTPMLAAKREGRFARLTFEHDFHWNGAGHTVAAEVIARAVAQGACDATSPSDGAK